MGRWTLLAALVFLAPLPARGQVVKELVGRYQLEVPDGPVLELRANGSATLGDDEDTWSARDGTLRVGEATMGYTLEKGRLVLTLNGARTSWKKLPTGGAPAPQPRAAQGAGGTPQDAEIRQTLMASPWCSFSYNKVSGASSTRRVVFRQDGAMVVSSGGESYSSGYGGTYAGQSRGQSTMRWKVESRRLLVDAGDGSGFRDVALGATRSSSGGLVLHADGQEYVSCN